MPGVRLHAVAGAKPKFKPIMYHYTTEKRWNLMHEGTPGRQFWDQRIGDYSDGQNAIGLFPQTKAVLRVRNASLPKDAYHRYTFGLFEPVPAKWAHDEGHPYPSLWGKLVEHVTIRDNDSPLVLLRVDLTPEVALDKVWVLDYAFMLSKPFEFTSLNDRLTMFFFKKNKDVMDRMWKKAEEEDRKLNLKAYERYWGSKVPLSQYNGTYSIPELITDQVIPFERIQRIALPVPAV